LTAAIKYSTLSLSVETTLRKKYEKLRQERDPPPRHQSL
jgi:hypothetical protein